MVKDSDLTKLVVLTELQWWTRMTAVALWCAVERSDQQARATFCLTVGNDLDGPALSNRAVGVQILGGAFSISGGAYSIMLTRLYRRFSTKDEEFQRYAQLP